MQVTDVLIDDEESERADCGDNVKLKLKNIEEEDVSAGTWLPWLLDGYHGYIS